MRRIMSLTILLGAIVTWVPDSVLKAQQAFVLFPAPLPIQIANGKKVFVSNAGEVTTHSYSGDSRRCYDQFYAALKSWGRYELVGSPGEADLVLEISFTNTHFGDQFRLVILDPGTRVVLWPFTEHIAFASRQANRDKNFDQALNLLVNDLRNVAGQPAASASKKQ